MAAITITISCEPHELDTVLEELGRIGGARNIAAKAIDSAAQEPLTLVKSPTSVNEEKQPRRGRKSNAEKAAEDVQAPAHEAPKGGPVVQTDSGPVVQTLDELKKDIDAGVFPGTVQTETAAEVRACSDGDVRKAIGVATKPLGFAKVQSILQGYLAEYEKKTISELTDVQRGVIVTRLEDEAGVKSNG